MKKNIVLLLILSSFCFSQTKKDSILKKDLNKIIDLIDFQVQQDQYFRNYLLFKTFDKRIIDSVNNLKEEDSRKYIMNKQLDQDFSNILKKDYILKNDSINTLKLIEIIKKYGYPSNKRIIELGGNININYRPILILVHSPKIFNNELINLIEEEKNNNNIGLCDYGYAMWHLKGRKDNSILKKSGIDYKENNSGKVFWLNTCEDE